MMRRATAPRVDLPDPLSDRVDAAMRRVEKMASDIAGMPDTAAGTIDRLDALAELRLLLRDVQGLLVAWAVEDAQVSQSLIAEVLNMDRTSVGRRAARYLPRLREILT